MGKCLLNMGNHTLNDLPKNQDIRIDIPELGLFPVFPENKPVLKHYNKERGRIGKDYVYKQIIQYCQKYNFNNAVYCGLAANYFPELCNIFREYVKIFHNYEWDKKSFNLLKQYENHVIIPDNIKYNPYCEDVLEGIRKREGRVREGRPKRDIILDLDFMCEFSDDFLERLLKYLTEYVHQDRIILAVWNSVCRGDKCDKSDYVKGDEEREGLGNWLTDVYRDRLLKGLKLGFKVVEYNNRINYAEPYPMRVSLFVLRRK